MAVAYVGLGSNMEDRTHHLVQACGILHRHPHIEVSAVSSLYHTPPVGVTKQAWFLNAVAQLRTTLSPQALLNIIQATERRLGRVTTRRWGPRVVDIDILLYDQIQLHRPFLHIPHLAMHERLFVLMPLYELSPELMLPSGVSLHDLIQTLVQDERIQRLDPFPAFSQWSV